MQSALAELDRRRRRGGGHRESVRFGRGAAAAGKRSLRARTNPKEGIWNWKGIGTEMGTNFMTVIWNSYQMHVMAIWCTHNWVSWWKRTPVRVANIQLWFNWIEMHQIKSVSHVEWWWWSVANNNNKLRQLKGNVIWRILCSPCSWIIFVRFYLFIYLRSPERRAVYENNIISAILVHIRAAAAATTNVDRYAINRGLQLWIMAMDWLDFAIDTESLFN